MVSRWMVDEAGRYDWSWETFLEPLINDWKPQASGRHAKRGFCNGKSLVARFSADLAEEHDEKSEEKVEAVSEAKAAIVSCIVAPSPFLSSKAPFKELERRWKNYEKALNIKSDREKSGSMWTMEMLEPYIKRQDIAFVQPERRFDLTDKALQKICERVDFAIKAVCGRDGTVENLNELLFQPNSTEADTRMILEAILQPLCVYKGLTVRSEQTIKSNELPTNRYDFIMYYKVDKPIGVVEAKRHGCLKAESVAQLLVQLLLLSSEQPSEFYFGVLSDAYQFIFAGVSKQKVWFFQTQEYQLEITTVKSDHDVRSIVGKISWLMDLAIQSTKSYKPIEEFLAPVAALKIQESFFSK